MTEQTNVMQDALVSIIQKTQQGIDASVSFLSEQIPDVIQQLLMWKLVEGLVIGGMLLLASLVAGKYFIKLWKYLVDESGEELLAPLTIFGIPTIFGLFISSLCWLKVPLQVYVAPKVYLIEYAASLVK